MWTPPTSANLPSIEEQLKAIPAENTHRFILIEAGYGFYKEQGYAAYDRQEQEIAGTPRGSKSGSWNNVYRQRDYALEAVDLLNANPPQKVAYDEDILNILIDGEEAYQNRFEQPLPEPKDPLADEEEVVFVGVPHEVGEIITDKYGASFVVTEPSYYISPQDAYDAEDSNDVVLEVGWHTNARRQKV